MQGTLHMKLSYSVFNRHQSVVFFWILFVCTCLSCDTRGHVTINYQQRASSHFFHHILHTTAFSNLATEFKQLLLLNWLLLYASKCRTRAFGSNCPKFGESDTLGIKVKIPTTRGELATGWSPRCCSAIHKMGAVRFHYVCREGPS